MRVAWFTPLSQRSAIAEYSLQVGDALSQLCEVDLWVPGTAGAKPTELPVVEFGANPQLLEQLRPYDLCVYNIGNHERFHGAIYGASQRHPGVVVVHDRVLHHFFFAHWLASGRQDVYLERLERLYGLDARRAAEESFAGVRPPLWEDDEAVSRLPLAEEALVGAHGAVVHARDHAAALEERWFGPIARLFHPAYPPPDGAAAAISEELRPDGRTTLLTVGHVNRNKQIHRVVEAIAAHRLQDRARYLVVGSYDAQSSYVVGLRQLIDRLGLGRTVVLGGYQPDDVLAALMGAADALVNLRYPSFEGASGSLMHGLAAGKPTLVYDTASFAELPDTAVVKVPPGDPAALGGALEELVTSETLRAETGEAAKVAAAERSTTRYARELIAFADEVRYWEPAISLCDRVADELAELGVAASLDATSTISHETSVVLAEERPGPASATRVEEIRRRHHAALARFFARNDVAAVVDHFDPFPFTPETARQIALEPRRDRYYGAFLGARLIGLSMLRGWDEGYEIPSFGIAIDAQFHGAGLGTRLTEWTLDQAQALGCPAVRLSVYARNERAHRIYERLGFREVERATVERKGQADERIVMVKDLDRA